MKTKKRRKFNNKHSIGTIEYDIFEYFSRMDVRLSDEKLNHIIKTLKHKENILEYLDKIQAKLNTKDYHHRIAEELQEERKIKTMNRLKNKEVRKMPVNQLNMSGEYITSFNSLEEASYKLYGNTLNYLGMHQCCLGNYTHSGGFIWEFKEDNHSSLK